MRNVLKVLVCLMVINLAATAAKADGFGLFGFRDQPVIRRQAIVVQQPVLRFVAPVQQFRFVAPVQSFVAPSLNFVTPGVLQLNSGCGAALLY